MENQIEQGQERIPTKEEILEIIKRFKENTELVRELSDEKGLFLLETKIEGNKPAEVTQYEYMRQGRFPGYGQSSETAIHVVYYEGEIPTNGHKVAVYNPESGEWVNT